MTLCYFCHRPIKSFYIQLTGQNRYFHPLEDEYGNAAPKDVPSCWDKSDSGRLTLEEYLVELYRAET